MDEAANRELTGAVDELADTLEDLREELREPPRGPLGLPRPPTPGELLRFTERYTIPTVIALLETSIRALELLSAAIRLADGRPLEAPDRAVDAGRSTGVPAGAGRLASVSRRTLRTLDDALGDLQRAVAEGSPDDPELRRLLEQARALREEVDDRLADVAAEEVTDGRRSEGRGRRRPGRPEPPADAVADDPVEIDVEEEIESIKRDLDDTTKSGTDRSADDQPEGEDGRDGEE